ncbi:hypothetical protein [Marinobacter sp. Arc7-DN-1]|uniref:hypothetical protein n=1 Tax=Marinobacter sp. Arc7-DN-1 TaxID=2304594 RepID=UPI000E43EB8A|nr:hypothetical protein [Marinobacter sp. Arc7-DN-1]AXS82513.1 hypothetical protein D0851_05385 [Marinobacter sp. Arc7-DN-1]
MKVRIFTKSDWNEPPRIRHQFANLMNDNGHDVVFYQKPKYLVSERALVNDESTELRRTAQLIHHQLRLGGILSALNAAYEIRSINRNTQDVNSDDLIVNFNYDYFFLRDVFPDNKIITIINDDFVAQSRFFDGKYAGIALEKTCRISDVVLCVSYPLCDQVRAWSSPKLFLPWSAERYEYPETTNRTAVLLWAHINNRIDFDLVRFAASNNRSIDLHLIGPVSEAVSSEVRRLDQDFDNVVLVAAMPLTEIDFTKYFAAIIPYKSGKKEIEAVSASNKTFQLLGKGMPLVISGMPSFIQSRAIRQTATKEEFLEAIEFCKRDFYRLQDSVRDLVSENGAHDRYRQFMDIVESLE